MVENKYRWIALSVYFSKLNKKHKKKKYSIFNSFRCLFYTFGISKLHTMTQQSTYNIHESFFKVSTKNAQFQHYFRFGSINFRWTYCYLKLSSIHSINISNKKIEKITFFKLLPVDDGSDGNKFEMHFLYLILAIYHPWKFQASIFNNFR